MSQELVTLKTDNLDMAAAAAVAEGRYSHDELNEHRRTVFVVTGVGKDFPTRYNDNQITVDAKRMADQQRELRAVVNLNHIRRTRGNV